MPTGCQCRLPDAQVELIDEHVGVLFQHPELGGGGDRRVVTSDGQHIGGIQLLEARPASTSPAHTLRQQ